MKKIISMLLTVSMLLSALPFSAFAENEIIDTEVVTETQEETIDESKIGTEVEIGNDLYSIQEDGLYVSKDFGRDTLLAGGEITWVIEHDGALYWSKIEGYNADIYRLNLENGNETILTRVFAPATAFDVEGDFVYYLYNGEISKVNVLTGEEVSMGMYNCDGFYLDEGNIIKLNQYNDSGSDPDYLGDSIAEIMAEENCYLGQCSVKNLSFISNTTRKKQLENRIKQYILTNNTIEDDLSNGKFAIFLFEGGSDNMDKSEFYCDYNTYRVFAVCIVVKRINGEDTVIYACENCSTLPDRQLDYSKNARGKRGWAAATATDGTYPAYTVNHRGDYAALSLRQSYDNYNIPSVYMTSNGYEKFNALGINVHTRRSQKKLNSGSAWSEGCQLIGTQSNYSDYLKFIEIISQNIAKYKNVFYKTSNIYYYTSGKNKHIGSVTIDRKLFVSEMKNIYKNSEAVDIIVKNSLPLCSNCSLAPSKDFSYKGNGVCTNCEGTPYDYNASWTTSDIKDGVGVYKPNSVNKYGKLTIWKTPYTKGGQKGSTKKFNTIKIKARVINADGGKWYEVEADGEKGYIVKYKVDSDYNYDHAEAPEINFNNLKFSKNNSEISFYDPLKLDAGKSCGLRGTITSNASKFVVTATIYRADTNQPTNLTHTQTIKNGECNLKGEINNRLTFNRLSAGNYYLKYTVKAYYGKDNKECKEVSKSSGSITVGNVGVMPSFSEKSISGGREVKISCGDKNATIKYSVDNGKEKTISAGQSESVKLKKSGNHIIKAYSVSGSIKSQIAEITVDVPKSKLATIFEYIGKGMVTVLDTDIDINYDDKSAYAIISGEGDIHYTTDGSTPTENSPKYTTPIPLKNSCTVKAISIEYGCAPSDVTSKELIIKEPDPPTVSLKDTKPKIAQGKTATVSWEPIQYATSYHAYLYYNGACVQEIKDIKGTTAAFKLTEVGDYTIKVKAKNFKGLSADSNGVVVSSMAPVWVTFVDRVDINVQDNVDRHVEEEAKKENIIERQIIEGNTLLKQKVDYDEVPVRPAVPSKKGYIFAGWSKEAYEPALTDITVYAEYEINYYTVAFYDMDDDFNRGALLDSRQYKYTDTAITPSNYDIPDGYVFGGWNVDAAHSECFNYNYVEGNMQLDAVYSWANMELPVFLNITSIIRDNKSYRVNINLKNNPVKDSQGRLIIALYTDSGRNVYTQTEDIDLDLGSARSWTALEEITLNYTGHISKASAFVVAVDNDKTGGALSDSVSYTNISYDPKSDFWTAWSGNYYVYNQSEIPAETDTKDVYYEKQYRYRDKQYTTTDYTKYLSGWDYLYTTPHTYGPYYNGTSWLASENNDWRKRDVYPYTASKNRQQWKYHRYYGWSTASNCWKVCAYSSGICTNYEETGWIDYPLTWEHTTYFGGKGYSSFNPAGTPFDTRNRNWYMEEQRTVTDTWTEYQYYDTYYTHYFSKWGGFTGWSTSKPSSSSDRQIEERYMYRYRTITDKADDSEVEDVYTYHKEGILTGCGTEYVTEAEYNTGNYSLVSGPYYKKNDGEYILVSESTENVTRHRYGRVSNGTYGMACIETAEETYGGNWEWQYSDWITDEAKITKDALSCSESTHEHINYSRVDGDTYYWDSYEVNGEIYYSMETKNGDEEVTYTDKTKYYLVNIDLEGEVATVMIYKKTNTDPTQEQLEYVQQIRLGNGNSYEINASTKEELSQETGDFIVCIALEGGKKLINVDTIIAPIPMHKVHFNFDNGEEELTVEVPEGSGVDLSDEAETPIPIPLKEGFRFVKWDKSVVNIKQETFVKAIYEREKYNIVFVDHENETTEMKELYFGDPIPAPEVEPVYGKEFSHWEGISDTESNVVNGSKIITAVWNTNTYTVKFCDLDGNVLERETQEVAYGEAAELPDPIIDGGVVYPWDTTGDSWWNVTKDMTIYPYSYTTNTLSAPITDVATGDYDEYLLVNLEADENSKIYYSTYYEITEEDAERYVELQQQGETISLFSTGETSGEDGEISDNESMDADTMLQEMISEFTETIPITYSTVIYAFTVDEDGNISTISSFEYNINEYEPEEEKFVPADDVEQITMPSVVAKPGETVEVPLTLKNNPGVKNLSLILGYDAENLELVSVTNGEVFANSEFSKDTREDGSCKLEWLTTTENTNNGILATLTFKAKENSGEFNIGFDEVTSSDGEEEEYFAVVDGTVANVGKDVLVGDTNGDGEITYADAILLIRHDIGFTSLSDYQKSISDVNGDGEVDFADAIKVLRYDAGFINTLK